jgi:putative phosphoesterase
MRVAALYDIHGNLPALEAVLAEREAAAADLIVVGGDFVMGPMPRPTLERLRGLGNRVRFIRGNTERDLLGGMADNPSEPQVWVARAAWVARQLERDDRIFLGGLPTTLQLNVDGLGLVLFCHGTPRSDEEIVTRATPVERILPALAGVSAEVVICGHTHMQYDRVVRAVRLVNSGSVGMPYEGQPGARWALLGPGVELRRTQYDLEEAARQIIATRFPEAEEFSRKYVLASPRPEDAIQLFEAMARARCLFS